MKILEFLKAEWLAFWREEDGIGVVEVILILVVSIALVLIFKEKMTSLVNSIFQTITTESGRV